MPYPLWHCSRMTHSRNDLVVAPRGHFAHFPATFILKESNTWIHGAIGYIKALDSRCTARIPRHEFARIRSLVSNLRLRASVLDAASI